MNFGIFNDFRCKETYRDEWIKAIEIYHPVDKFSNFFVCIRHFKETDYSKSKSGFTLKPNVVPSIFDVTNHLFNQSNPSNPSSNHNCLPNTFDGTQITNVDIDESNLAVANDVVDIDESNGIVANDIVDTLESQITLLKTEHINLRLHYDIQIQTYKQKIISLTDKIDEKNDILNQTRAELSQEISRSIKLNKTIDELRRNRYIDGENVANVNHSIN